MSRLLKQPVVLLLVKFPEIALLADCAIGHFKQAMVKFPELAPLYRLRDWKHLNFIFVPDGGAPCKRDNILLFTRSNVLGSRDSRVRRHREKIMSHIMIRVGLLFAPTMLRDTLGRGRLPLKLIFKSLCFSMPIASYRLLKQFKTCNGKCKRRAIRLSRLLKQPVVLLLVKFPEIALLADCAIGPFS